MSKKAKKQKVITWRDKPKAADPKPEVVEEELRIPTREEVLEARADLVAIQLNPVHALIKPKGPHAERVYAFMVCPKCPAKAECEAASVKLSELESSYFARPL